VVWVHCEVIYGAHCVHHFLVVAIWHHLRGSLDEVQITYWGMSCLLGADRTRRSGTILQRLSLLGSIFSSWKLNRRSRNASGGLSRPEMSHAMYWRNVGVRRRAGKVVNATGVVGERNQVIGRWEGKYTMGNLDVHSSSYPSKGVLATTTPPKPHPDSALWSRNTPTHRSSIDNE
jgi:hypothetical protein